MVLSRKIFLTLALLFLIEPLLLFSMECPEGSKQKSDLVNISFNWPILPNEIKLNIVKIYIKYCLEQGRNFSDFRDIKRIIQELRLVNQNFLELYDLAICCIANSKPELDQLIIKIVEKAETSISPLVLLEFFFGEQEAKRFQEIYCPDSDNEAAQELISLSTNVQGSVENTKLLIKQGVNINYQNIYGYTPLMLAARENNKAIVTALIDAGAKINRENRDGYVTLVWSICSNSYEIVSLVVSAGSFLDARGRQDGYTALMLASSLGSEPIVELLIQAGAKLDLQDCRGYTALMESVEQKSLGATKILLQAGANINLTNNAGGNALSIAVAQDYSEAIKLLKSYLKK